MSFKFLIIAALITAALAGKYGKGKGGDNKSHGKVYNAPQRAYGRPRLVHIPVYNYGPDNAKYRYSSPFYDRYAYQHANVHFNRFPGGVKYNHNVNGYGADVRVSFQSYPSANYGGQKGRAY